MNDFSRTLKLVTVWLLLGSAVFIGVQALQSQQQRTQFHAAEGVIEIRRAADGHYHWPGSINGVPVDFLIDTGATSTALPRALAQRAGLRSDGHMTSSTAGGNVRGELARADVVLRGGVRASSLRVAVLPGLEAPLLGMDLLSRMHWTQRSVVLRITPPGAVY